MPYIHKNQQEKMHLMKTYKDVDNINWWNAACGRIINDSHVTFNKDLVTCKNCKRTKEYHGR